MSLARRILKSMERAKLDLLARKQARLIRAASVKSRKLHLACGPVVREGWINLDIEARRGILVWDLRRSLPLEEKTVDLIYAEHFIEHLSLQEGEALMRDCYRVLDVGGVLRLSTPDLVFVIEEYRANRLTEWSDMGWRPTSGAQMINEAMRLWGHQFLYDKDELFAALTRSGFSKIRECGWRQSGVADLEGAESRPYHREIIVEAVKM